METHPRWGRDLAPESTLTRPAVLHLNPYQPHSGS